jgi:hypothetical protein
MKKLLYLERWLWQICVTKIPKSTTKVSHIYAGAKALTAMGQYIENIEQHVLRDNTRACFIRMDTFMRWCASSGCRGVCTLLTRTIYKYGWNVYHLSIFHPSERERGSKMKCWSLPFTWGWSSRSKTCIIQTLSLTHWQQAACIDYDIIFTLLSIGSQGQAVQHQ